MFEPDGALKYQQNIVDRLQMMIAHGHLPHALLFSGISGTGKKTAADAVAMALNCRSAHSTEPLSNKMTGMACGECRPCKKIKTGNHPDILSVKADGKLIVISKIRGIVEKLVGKPFEATRRVVIIEEATSMNTEAANALLKVLEEPPSNTVFILTTEKPEELLPTVLSRCQHIRFQPVSSSDIEDYLVDQFNLSRDRATAMASLADGSLKKAEHLVSEKSKWLELRNLVAHVISEIKESQALYYFNFAERFATDRQSALEMLDIMTLYIRDLMVYRYAPTCIFNQDIIESVARQSTIFQAADLIRIYGYIEAARKAIESNSSLRLTLEVMAMDIAEV